MKNDHILVMQDEDGNKIEFEYLDRVEYKGKDYVVLLPTEAEADSVLILQIESEDEEKTNYLFVDDDATADAVYHLFKEHTKDLYEFLD